MSDQENVEYKLDTLTRTVRVVAGIAPKAMTRVSLGVMLAVDDAANDPAGELLGSKFVAGAKTIPSTVGSIARATGGRVNSTAVSMKNRVDTDEMPSLGAAKAFVVQAASEVRESWDAAGIVNVEFVDEIEPLESSGESNAVTDPEIEVIG